MKKETSKILHYDLDYRPVHIAYRLAGSLPMAVLDEIKAKHERRKAPFASISRDNPELRSPQNYAERLFAIEAQFELDIDDALHKITTGPFHLANPLLAQEVINSWTFFHDRCEIYLYAVCVMGNHVHAVVRAPDQQFKVDISKLMSRHKTFTARACNALLGTTGSPFWEQFYFDRTVRQNKFERVMWYVLNNPVKAGLVSNWRDWGGTYLNPDFDSIFR